MNTKEKFGCWLHERWKTEVALWMPGSQHWIDLHNRHEKIELDSVTGGRVCCWRDSSPLTVSRIFPAVGSRLLKKCLHQWPIRLNFEQSEITRDNADASVLLAIGGSDRIRQFHMVLASLRGQSHPSMEIIVVEQSETPELESELPSDIRYIHSQKRPDKGFNKSWALNVAARHAKGKSLLIHDADYVVPRDYVGECCRVLQSVEAVRPSRFNFHLDKDSTLQLIDRRMLGPRSMLEYIIQNNPTPMAVRKDVYWQVGGHDESFVGWGGEDVEFLSRLRTRSIAEGGWLPTIHLWHPPAPQKANGHRNQQQQDDKLSADPTERIDLLRSLPSGGDEPLSASEPVSS